MSKIQFKSFIPRSPITSIAPGSGAVFVFDTDVNKTDVLLKNIKHMKDTVSQGRIVNLYQVLNFEDEIVRLCAPNFRDDCQDTFSAG